ncbi:cyclic nucleotide-binding domain-containing protein [Variovorax sp. PCZ-1]|uniref:cyclic nucleotide-binding domain-containing protein n=1 Tax=Variovorax sp. PCZ-1 TaxID=2835533 RepID=UPI0020BEAD06|nr:cyclic nucleotide-binding domain-containing protein [Variovorax sp. PCZ-1]
MTESEIQHVAKLLRSGAAFHGMPEKISIRLAALMAVREFAPGTQLTREGDANAGYLMILVSGEAEISSKHTQEGGHLVHRLAQPGHIIGEVGFIDGQVHSATCEALVFTRAAVLSRDDFIAMFETDALSAAQLMAGLLRLLARRIRHANHHMIVQDQQILQLQTELLSLQQAKMTRSV